MGKYSTVSLKSLTGKIMEQIILKTMLRQMENKLLMKLYCLSLKCKDSVKNVVAFYDGVPVLVDKERVLMSSAWNHTKHLTLSPHDTFVSKLKRHRLDRWDTGRIKNWLMFTLTDLRLTFQCPRRKQ